MCKHGYWVPDPWCPYCNPEAAKELSGKIGELERERDKLKEQLEYSTALLGELEHDLKQAIEGESARAVERDNALDRLAEVNRQIADERGMHRNWKIADREQYQMITDQRTEERDAARRDRDDLQKRLSTLNDQLLEASTQAVDAKAKLAEKERECQVLKDKLEHAKEGQECWWKKEGGRLQSQLETAQRQVDRLLWASRRVRDGYPQEARGTYYEDLCTVIRVVESGLAGRDYVHKDEVSRAVEDEREACAKIFQCSHCQEAIRARGKS